MSLATITTAGLFMTSLGVSLAGLLAFANKKLFVFEDPRIDEVEAMLPNANCGACGQPGCRSFAESTVSGTIDPGRCTVNTPDMNQAIANLLGVEVLQYEKVVARLACSGGSHVSYTRASYAGLSSCRAAALVSGGGKGCTWGCLGFGDCADVCDFNAIHLDRFSLPQVSNDQCTACGDCVDVCPKDLFSLQPMSNRLWIACKNRDIADEGEAHCELVCTACGRCAADSPEGLITMENNLAMVNYDKNDLASPVAIERCPTGAIVWLDNDRGVLKGSAAKKVTRKEPLPPRMEPLPRA